ncbi:MAG: hypothetical protein LBC85_04680 [Fibromonadaceae bacterium]|jgi:hypothetical protein|nr:hypothetical protein [Fibromonadaceae bacterium]
MNPLILGAALALLPECPYFTEFLPHPVHVPDAEGEYFMVKWESPIVPWDTIYFQLDEFNGFSIHVPSNSFYTELLLHRGAPAACPEKDGLLCLPLTGRMLPNTRATVWNLRAGACRDTAYLPVPRPGMVIRKNDGGEWVLSSSSSMQGSGNALTLDSILSIYGEIPLYVSEVAPCPGHGIPEWFEITNRTMRAFPLNGISDCKRAPLNSADSIRGKSSVLITRNSTDLVDFLQTDEIPVYQVPIAALRNTNDTLRLCYNGIQLDSVMWGRAVNRPIICPSMERISPGFVPRVSSGQTKALHIAERVLKRSKRNTKLRVSINSEKPVELRLIDRGGVGIMRRTLGIEEVNAAWIEIPEWRKCQNGPCFIHVQGDGIDETAAFIVRP